MINALDREAFKSGTKVLALGLFILGSGIFLAHSVLYTFQVPKMCTAEGF